ncbi:MAG: LysR family transcriptional regulator [Gemmobacter sp.]|nr:LysR family transcriptional regulator [Gemmobacter sp.]
MEIKWLEDFVALAETSSFSRAAGLRNVTQPAFSRRIKQLESWLGAMLISRSTMPAELTPAGRSFLPVAQDAIRTFYSAREALRPPAETGLVRFAALHTLTMTFLADWLGRLAPPFGTSVLPDKGGIEANLDALVSDEADFFLTYAHAEVPFHLDRAMFDYLTIGHDRLLPVAAPEVRLPQQTCVGRGILDRAMAGKLTLPYLSYGPSSFFGVALNRVMARSQRFKPRIVHESTISEGLMAMALTGAGMCWLPESLASPLLGSGRLVMASQSALWQLDLEIRLYRHVTNPSKTVNALWNAASRVQGAVSP